MKRSKRSYLGALVVAATAACAPPATTSDAPPSPTPAPPSGAPAATPPATGTASVYSGVYTAAQATRGQQIQQRECANCHSPGDWSQGRLLSGWNGQPVFALLDNIRMTMPMDGPGRLSMQQYTDVVAFILQLNEIPPGDAELPANEEGLRRIQIEYRR